MLARDAGRTANDVNGLLHTLRGGVLPTLTRIQSILNALAILGIAGSLMFLAISMAASLRPHLRWIID